MGVTSRAHSPAMLRLACLLACFALPARSEDLAETGERLFLRNCARCHGQDASGGNAPDIRHTPRNFVLRAIRGFEEMPEIPLTDAEIDAITAWLNTGD